MDIKIINLSTEERDSIMIEETRFIHICRNLYNEKGIFGFAKRFLNLNQNIDKVVYLDITNIDIDPRLVIGNKNNLFTIFYDVEKTNQKDFPLKISLSRLKEAFFIMLNANEIVDCTESQHCNTSETFYIRYTVRLKDDSGNVIDAKDEQVEIQFINENNVPEARLFLEPNQIQYKSNAGLTKIGRLIVKLPNTLNYAPSVDVKISLRMQDEALNIIDDLLVIKKADDECDEIIEKGLRAQQHANGKAKAVTSYNLYVDFDKIANPLGDISKYTIVSDAAFKYSYENTYIPFSIEPATIDVLKDKQSTEMYVRVFRGENLLQGAGVWNIPDISFTASVLVHSVKFSILNKATDTSRPGAGLTISNLHILTSIDKAYSLYDKQSESLEVGRIITLRNLESEMQTNEGLFIPNGENAETNFSLSFNPENIYTIRYEGNKTYSFNLITTIDFDYKEDASGDGTAETKHYKGTLNWKLIKRPNPEWLCVDFGSSAIVCYYGKGSQSRLINLREARQKVYESALKSNANQDGFAKDEIKDSIEQNTPFLSSDILLHDVKNSKSTSLCSQISAQTNAKYNCMAVLLSPTEKLSAKNFRRQLPCLKILMGNMYLPENDHYNEFRYNYQDENNIVKSDIAKRLKDKEYSLLNIENIFKETYHTLFRFFIQDEAIIEQANKVVLTYPNTYTPHNLLTMKKIVTQTLPAVREVEFISESDSVAAYYMAHWSEYHASTEDIRDDENILVYDMGAGTLDVTYLTKRYDSSREKFLLEICGKMGTGRAGNYLDYIIVQILYNKLSAKNFKKSWINTDMKAVEQEELEARVMLKQIVKTKIKPGLSGTAPIKFEINRYKFEIMPEDILQDKLFETFLYDVTDSIWSNIRKHVGEERFKVDTIIMSGRSLRLKELQERIENQASNDNAKCIKLDAITNGANKGMENDRSKTAVVEGAKTYVETYMSNDSPVIIRSRRLQASYGVAFKRTGGVWEYRELLNWKDMPYNDENKGEFSRPGGPLLVEHTNESDVLKFIQSYLSEDDTRDALNRNAEEFMSVMSEVMMSDFENKPSLNMNVIVDRNNNVSLYVDDMETKYRAPAGADLNDVITTRSLWPVSIINE